MARSTFLQVWMQVQCLAQAMVLALLASSVQAADSSGTARAIYRCHANGVTTFSDRPCAVDAQVYDVDTSRISTYSPEATLVSKTVAAKRSGKALRTRKEGSIAADQARHAAECTKVNDSLRDVRAKMRAGYSSKQGEQLRARQKQLESKRRNSRCR
jgi:hypothetical protein